MRGLKPLMIEEGQPPFGRIFYRCVDWNLNIVWHGKDRSVASFTDAWIETIVSIILISLRNVASFTDAWIETLLNLWSSKKKRSHLLQMRGLKPTWSLQVGGNLCRIFYRCVDWNIFIGLGYARPLVASFTDAWIETRCCLCEDSCRESHLLQMRGLKLTFAVENSIWKVASFTDAWIETVRMRLYITLIFGRIFYRCVDWNCDEESIVMGIMCRIFYRCVDWNKAS